MQRMNATRNGYMGYQVTTPKQKRQRSTNSLSQGFFVALFFLFFLRWGWYFQEPLSQIEIHTFSPTRAVSVERNYLILGYLLLIEKLVMKSRTPFIFYETKHILISGQSGIFYFVLTILYFVVLSKYM